MRRLDLLLIVLLVGPVRADDAPVPTKEQMLARLQGVWQPQRMERGGNRESVGKEVRLSIKDGHWMFGKLDVADIEIDPATHPMIIDLRVKVDLAEAEKGQTMEGIFKIEGDTLTCCFSRSRGQSDKQRPADFVTRGDDRLVLAVFRRVQP